MNPEKPHDLKLDLVDGRRWIIRPADDGAAVVVKELGKAMQLEPAHPPYGSARELWCATVPGSGPIALPGTGSSGAVVCCVWEPRDREMLAIGMAQIADAVAREATVHGGLLVHGALAERGGNGFVMAGPGTVGKSTASRRLPAPWRSLCDDMTLVVRDGRGGYWAHPWPTWSRFNFGGRGGSWPVEQAVPLSAIFFLSQAPSDRLEPVSAVQATALLLESDVNIVRAAAFGAPGAVSSIPAGVGAAKALAATVPAYRLELSLDGQFWDNIERVLPVAAAPSAGDTIGRCPMAAEPQPVDGSLRLVYTGDSMYPTLVDPELVEVEPYNDRRVCRGDIVCFRPPTDSITVVHRVVGAGPEGIRTRGDNNPENDPGVLRPGVIIGRVRAAQRGTRRRVVSGGWRGLVALRCVRLGRGAWRLAGHVPRALYRLLAKVGPFDWLLPAGVRPRLVRFDARYRVFLKVLMGGRSIGQYDDRRREWHIRRPFALFVGRRVLKEALTAHTR